MKLLFKVLPLALLLNLSPVFAYDLSNNESYAMMQQCLAGAELEANSHTQLDRYCINSYLAALPQNQSSGSDD